MPAEPVAPAESERSHAPKLPGTLVGNLGDPIILTNVQLNGVAAEAAQVGDTLKVWTKLAITSDDPLFHRIAQGLTGALNHLLAATGRHVNFDRIDMLLVVIKPDGAAELWADTAAVSLLMRVKRDVAAGTAIFEQDIADVAAMAFPLVDIGKEDKVICLFRQDWRFALCFDFNPGKDLSVEEFQRTLGTLFRGLKFRHIYDAIENPEVFGRLIDAGWFPFTEIITSEFRDLTRDCEAGFPFTSTEEKIQAVFDETRLERMLQRWLAKPHFASREPLLRAAIKHFIAKEDVAVIKIVLTEIEGILNDAHRQAHGSGAKIPKLLDFAITSAEHKAGGPYTLLLPKPFAQYLKTKTYADFDPKAGAGDANMRHAVGHGQAAAATYTHVAALQALLTLDQFSFSL